MKLLLALVLAAVVLPAAARAQTMAELCRQAGGSDCEAPRGYVHPAGWIVDPSRLQDKRFTPAQLRAALDEAARKFSPSLPVSNGGCLAAYNKSRAKELTAFLHANPVLIKCPAYDPIAVTCADYTKTPSAGGIIRILNVGPCLDENTTGLAGTMFHETLHADGADSLPVEKHNNAVDLPQYVFVTDRVYGTESLCFLGVDARYRKQVNILQCRAAVNYQNERPDPKLCSGFNTVFYDTIPPSTTK